MKRPHPDLSAYERTSTLYNTPAHLYATPGGRECSPSPEIAVSWVSIGGKGRAPYRKYRGDAGYDLFVSEPALILARAFQDVHTNVAIAMPPGLWGRITGRSSTLRKRGLLVNEGIIDGEYRGELFIGVFNLQDDPVEIEEGDRIGQIIFHYQESIHWRQSEHLGGSDRGAAGFGSTGR